jgi:hypothetical protein
MRDEMKLDEGRKRRRMENERKSFQRSKVKKKEKKFVRFFSLVISARYKVCIEGIVVYSIFICANIK